MAKLSSSCSIRSTMAAEFLPFSHIFNPCRTGPGRRNVECGCVMTGDGAQTQAAKGGIKAHITCSISKKVYEDQVKGIACYIDGNGEMVCEGYDEGPRPDDHRLFDKDGEGDLEFIELLEQSWLRIANGSRCVAGAEYADEEYIN